MKLFSEVGESTKATGSTRTLEKNFYDYRRVLFLRDAAASIVNTKWYTIHHGPIDIPNRIQLAIAG